MIDEAMKIVESDRRANPDETDTEYFSHPVSVEQGRAVMNFKKIIVIAIMMVTASAWTATVTDVTAKQRYPWNGLVDITCKVQGINGTTNGLKFAVAAVMPDSGDVRKASQFWLVQGGTNSTYREVHTNGNYRLLWDARSDLGQMVYSNVVVRVNVDDLHGKVQLWEGGPYWATTNIGAEEPWEYGYYFWWGDTIGYKRENNAWVASDGSYSSFSFTSGNTPTHDKNVTTLQSEGWITTAGVLAPEHDAAHVQWGGTWRMPTDNELSALGSNCDWTWTVMNGVNGYVVRGKGDYASAFIFLPCGGVGYGTSLYFTGNGYCWSSVPRSDTYGACELLFSSDYHGVMYDDGWGRQFGFSVRPVQGVGDIQGTESCTVTFNANGGSGGTVVTRAYGAVVGTLPTPMWEGHDFGGWWTAADGGTQVTISTIVTSDVMYYAHWTVKSYTVTYLPGTNGSGTQQTTTKLYDVALVLKGAIFMRDGYNQTGWATSDGGGKIYDLGASYTVNAGITLYPFWTAATSHGKVQLWAGGPYWAETNIGAEKPWESGYYFWWGDTIGYRRENNKWVASDGSSSNFLFDSSSTPTYHKTIATLQSEGWVVSQDGIYVLAPEHDAAHVQWGGAWRMPTYQELDDLCYNKCDWTWTTQNGVNGYVVRGRGDYASNSIFLPCAGMANVTSLDYSGSSGYYWSSVPYSVGYYSWYLNFLDNSDLCGTYYGYYRQVGQSIRPVQGFDQ